MNEIICHGLDGANPLHFLASLGAFRLLCLHDATAKMVWCLDNAWHPVYHTVLDDATLAQQLANDMLELGKVSGGPSPEKNRKVRELGTALKKAMETAKDAKKVADGEAKQQKLAKEAKTAFIAQKLTPITTDIARLENELAEAQSALNDALGEGIAHLGDIIGVTPDIFRRRAKTAVDAWLAPAGNVLLAESLSAQAVDGVTDGGKMRPTPFSFSNGSSGQCLLKDFRNCAALTCAVNVSGTLHGTAPFLADVTGLNWDPASQRSYALQWDDPASGSISNPALNAMAFLGLGFMTVVPDGATHTAMGWIHSREEKGFIWAMWIPPLTLDVVRALLAASTMPTLAMGIGEQFFSQCINPTGKRNFFAPARPV